MTQCEIIMTRDTLVHFSFFPAQRATSEFHRCLQSSNNVIRVLMQVLCYRDYRDTFVIF